MLILDLYMHSSCASVKTKNGTGRAQPRGGIPMDGRETKDAAEGRKGVRGSEKSHCKNNAKRARDEREGRKGGMERPKQKQWQRTRDVRE
jgi:hypothetical protein